MRNRQIGALRRRLGVALVPGLIVIAMAALAGCSSGGSSSESTAAAGAPAAHAAEGAAAAAPSAGAASASAAAPASGGGGTGQAASAARLAATGQQLIYTAQLTVRAHNVGAAISRATTIVSQAGGYVSSENASSDPNHPSQSTATIALKIPAAVYAATLAELAGGGLGTQLSLQQQAQDVTQQVADVTSRVASDKAAIAQLRSLLTHAGSVADLLSVQNQINGEESDLEAMQAQQSALNRETAYATVTVTVLGPKAVPKAAKQKPPPGLGNGLGAGWHAFRVTLSWLLAILGAVLPFVAVVAVLGAAGYWGRRWIRARGAGRSRPASGS
jgi:cell division protein FtsB